METSVRRLSIDTKYHLTTRYVITVSLIYIAAVCFSAFYPQWFTWGLSSLQAFSQLTVILLTVSMVLFLIPGVQQVLLHTYTRYLERYNLLTVRTQRTIILSAFVFLIFCFRYFDQKLFFLGDGYLLLRNLPLFTAPIEVFGFYKNSPLSGFIVYSASAIFKTIGVQNYSLAAYQWVSILSGILTIFTLKETGKMIFTDSAMRLLFIVGIMSTAASQMFFSYVENYSIGILAVVIYIFCSAKYLTTGKHFPKVTLSFIVLVLSHYGMALIVPSYLYLLYREFTRKRFRNVVLNLLSLAAVVGSLYVAVYNKYPLLYDDAFRGNSHLLIHSVPGTLEYSYSFFSYLHLIDILNLIVFVSPFIVLLIPNLIRAVRIHDLFLNDIFIFFALCCAGTLLFVVGMKSDLGLSRDWDLFTLYLFPTIIAAVIFVLKSTSPEHSIRQTMIIFGITFLHSASWIAINTSRDISLQYFMTLHNDILWSKKATAHTMDELGSYFQQRGDYKNSLQFNLKYLEYDPANLRMIENVASTYFYVFSDDANAQHWCENAVNAGSKDWRIFNNLAIIKMKQQDYSSAMNLLKICISLNPQSTMPKLNLAYIIGTVKDKKEEAFVLYEEVLHNEPENANALLNAGYLSYQLKNYEKTKLYLDRYLVLLPNSPDSKNIQSLLRSLHN